MNVDRDADEKAICARKRPPLLLAAIRAGCANEVLSKLCDCILDLSGPRRPGPDTTATRPRPDETLVNVRRPADVDGGKLEAVLRVHQPLSVPAVRVLVLSVAAATAGTVSAICRRPRRHHDQRAKLMPGRGFSDAESIREHKAFYDIAAGRQCRQGPRSQAAGKAE